MQIFQHNNNSNPVNQEWYSTILFCSVPMTTLHTTSPVQSPKQHRNMRLLTWSAPAINKRITVNPRAWLTLTPPTTTDASAPAASNIWVHRKNIFLSLLGYEHTCSVQNYMSYTNSITRFHWPTIQIRIGLTLSWMLETLGTQKMWKHGNKSVRRVSKQFLANFYWSTATPSLQEILVVTPIMSSTYLSCRSGGCNSVVYWGEKLCSVNFIQFQLSKSVVSLWDLLSSLKSGYGAFFHSWFEQLNCSRFRLIWVRNLYKKTSINMQLSPSFPSLTQAQFQVQALLTLITNNQIIKTWSFICALVRNASPVKNPIPSWSPRWS